MDNRIAIIGIVVDKSEKIDELNAVLHEYSDFIVGRMGIPYKERGISVITIVIDAPADIVSAAAGKLGMLSGISCKIMYAKQADGD